MKDKQLTFLLLLIFGMGFFAIFLYAYTHGISMDFVGNLVKKSQTVQVEEPKYPEKLKLTSTAFTHEGVIPDKYSCKGADVNPPLTISNLPDGTKSLVMFLEDPDAPYQTWTHWIVFNMDPRQRTLAENVVPWNAKLGTNDFGADDYRGPCPPLGKHRYYFRLYAIDKTLDLVKGTKRQDIEAEMKDHILDVATLMGIFEK